MASERAAAGPSNAPLLRADLKHLHSPDLPDLEDSAPADPLEFRILVQALIGVDGDEAADTFDFTVCTPRWVAGHVTPERPLSGRGHIVVDHYDYDQIRAEIIGYCDVATGKTWEDVASILARFGVWEYERRD